MAALSSAAPRLKKGPAAVHRADLEWRRELSDICHELAIPHWGRFVGEIFTWLFAAEDSENDKRRERAKRLLEAVKTQATSFRKAVAAQDPAKVDAARSAIEGMLKTFVESIMKEC